MTDEQARALGACVAAGGVAVFPADTVYGLACDPENEAAITRLYALKGRPPEKPAAMMFFDLAGLPDFGGLLPGGVTLLLPNPEHRFPLACGPDPTRSGCGSRSSRRSDGRSCSPRRTARAARTRTGSTRSRASIRDGADLVLDGGELPGTPSTVIDLRDYEDGVWRIVRLGAVSEAEIAGLLGALVPVEGA